MKFLKSENFNPLRAKLLCNDQGLSKGTGFIQMASNIEAANVIDSLNSCMFDGRQLVINMANNQAA